MARRDIGTIQDFLWKQLVLNFMKNVTYHRKKNKWTQAELAEKARMNVATIADIEQGKASNPRLETIVSLTKAFKLNDPFALLRKR